jgi:predicted nucleotide-binding protein
MSERRVFIVHGHATADRDKLTKIVRDLGLTPVVLEFAAKKGRSVYEEFLDQARTCEFAFILLTPDDKLVNVDGTPPARARQNVIFEMGWFFGVLGRERTRLLYRGSIEIPSDVTGVVYIKYEHSLDEIRSDIRDALNSGGLATRN